MKKFKLFVVWTIDTVDTIKLAKLLKNVEFKSTWAGQTCVKAALVPCGFDIEATENFMYIWTFTIKYVTIIGYTWDDFRKLLEMLKTVLGLGKRTKEVTHRKDDKNGKWKAGDITEETSAPYVLPIFIHNLIYEYSFMRSEFLFNDVFFLDKPKKKTLEDGTVVELPQRNPLYLLDDHFFYIDSYKVCPKSLEKVALAFCDTHKKTGDLDYSVERNTEDAKHLTKEELDYCICDTRILSEFAQVVFDKYFIPYGKLPLTQNQIVESAIHRQYLKMDTKEKEKMNKYLNSISLTQHQYALIRRDGFRGGKVGSSQRHVAGRIIYGDANSFYGSSILHGYYPITEFRDITDRVKNYEDMIPHLAIKCCAMRLKFYNLRVKHKWLTYDGLRQVVRYMPDGSKPRRDEKDKVLEEDAKVLDESVETSKHNGDKILSAKCITTSLTEIDFELYQKIYDWEKFEILEFQTAQRGELPQYILDAMIEFYKAKAEKKKAGIRGPEYEATKVLVSNVFGAMIKKISTELLEGSEYDWWEATLDKELKPQWGVWISAHCRKTLIDLIIELGQRAWLYSDTDSLYILAEYGEDCIIEAYNSEQRARNKAICEKYGLDYNIFDDLGCFEDDGKEIVHFKTLGPKSYMYMTSDGHFEFVMSGMPEKFFWDAYDATHKKRTEKEVFDFFSKDTEITYVRKKIIFVDEEQTKEINGMMMTSKSGAIIKPDIIHGTLSTIATRVALEGMMDELEDYRV